LTSLVDDSTTYRAELKNHTSVKPTAIILLIALATMQGGAPAASVLLATSPRSEARPWSLTDIAPLLAGTDTIEVASTGAVLFNDHYADLKHDSIEESWLILEANGAIREIPRRLRVAWRMAFPALSEERLGLRPARRLDP